MRYLKLSGLAVIVAGALFAFGGAGSASATVLCKTTLTSGCAAAGWDYASGTAIHFVRSFGTHWEVDTSLADVTCTKATGSGSTTNTGGASETVKGVIQSLAFEECACGSDTTHDAHATVLDPGEFEIHHISGTHNGVATLKKTKVTYNCTPLGTQCVYTAGEGITMGTLTSGTPALLHTKATAQNTTGTGDDGTFLCGTTAKWEASLELTTPSPLVVAES